jgi:hypothetical protein
MVPKIMALQGLDSDNESSDSGDDFDMPEEAGEQVHPYRMRIWGMAASPGGGSTAVLVSRHSTLHPERWCKTEILFSWRPPLDSIDEESVSIIRNMTTEGRLWEWMYGGGPLVPGIEEGHERTVAAPGLRLQFKNVLASQRCIFCQGKLQDIGKQTKCGNGHVFRKCSICYLMNLSPNTGAATCSATGLAILKPGISRTCAVCGLRCLRGKELHRLAEEGHLGPRGGRLDISVDLCGVCGGKFVA